MVQKHPRINQLPWKPNDTYIIKFNIFLPFRDGSIGLPKLKFVEFTVIETTGGSAHTPLLR